jgi:hypothetical protein
MAEMMKDAFAWAFAKLLEVNSRTVTYRRGAQSVSLTAMIAGKQPVPLNSQGMQRTEQDFVAPTADEYQRDYLIEPATLILGGEATNPQQGDYIDDTNDKSGETHRYEVVPILGQPEYEKRDYLVWLRIHTKHLKTV